jgi:hypothetical protein
VDSVFSHLAWIQTPRNKGGLGGLSYPLLAGEPAQHTAALLHSLWRHHHVHGAQPAGQLTSAFTAGAAGSGPLPPRKP